MNDHKNVEVPTHQSLSGKYKVSVLDENDNIITEYPWQKNLILNQGMDAVPNHSFEGLMRYAAAGNGTRQNSILSGDTSGSVVGSTLTIVPGILSGSVQSLTGSYGGYSIVTAPGDIIQFNDISQSQVSVVSVSNLTAVVSPSSAISSNSFTIWKTSQVGLQSEIHRTSTYFAGTGYCGTTQVATTAGTVTQLRRTWDFAYETSSVTFTEVGVGWSSTSGDNTSVFSRILLPSIVYIGIAQKMRLIYELDVLASPSASYPGYPFTARIWHRGT